MNTRNITIALVALIGFIVSVSVGVIGGYYAINAKKEQEVSVAKDIVANEEENKSYNADINEETEKKESTVSNDEVRNSEEHKIPPIEDDGVTVDENGIIVVKGNKNNFNHQTSTNYARVNNYNEESARRAEIRESQKMLRSFKSALRSQLRTELLKIDKESDMNELYYKQGARNMIEYYMYRVDLKYKKQAIRLAAKEEEIKQTSLTLFDNEQEKQLELFRLNEEKEQILIELDEAQKAVNDIESISGVRR